MLLAVPARMTSCSDVNLHWKLVDAQFTPPYCLVLEMGSILGCYLPSTLGNGQPGLRAPLGEGQPGRLTRACPCCLRAELTPAPAAAGVPLACALHVRLSQDWGPCCARLHGRPLLVMTWLS